MKTCNTCGLEKPLEDFPKLSKNPDGLDYRCKLCKRAYDNAYYKNKPGRPEQIRASNEVATARAKRFVWEYLETHHCVDCGEADPIVLEFDHLRDKHKNISTLVSQGASLDQISAEIEKCEVRCANCHRRITAARAGWYAYANASLV